MKTQRKCRRVDYTEYTKSYEKFEDFKLQEFEKKFPLNKDLVVPPAFNEDLSEPNPKIGIDTMPKVTCSNFTMVRFQILLLTKIEP